VGGTAGGGVGVGVGAGAGAFGADGAAGDEPPPQAASINAASRAQAAARAGSLRVSNASGAIGASTGTKQAHQNPVAVPAARVFTNGYAV
jgi:hypothetical protein